MATTATPSPVLPHQTNNNLNNGNGKQSRPPGGSRMLRTLSRFLSGGNKQTKQTRPGNKVDTSSNQQANQEGEGGGLGLAGADQHQHHQEGEEEDGQDRTRSTSVSTAGQASSLVAQFPNDSRSRLSRQTFTSNSTSSSARTSPTPSINDNDDADTDASVYRLPPSTRGPSSITSRQTTRTHDSTSSFAPTHASTYRSNASTKPTTLLSVDSGGGGGGNRIAVVPGTGQPLGGGMTSSNSANSLSPASSPSSQPNHTFSSLSPSFVPTHTGHRPSTSSTSSSISIPPPPPLFNPTVGIPSHTLAHPRNNPHPSQFPNDNASLLTLASSSFAPSLSENRPPTERARNSWGGGGLTSLKAWSQKRGQVGSGSGSGKRGGNNNNLGVEADEDASVRVLPGSRRNSEESLGGRSTWSAGLGGGRSVVSVRVGDHDLDERERRRSSMKTVETGENLDQGEEREEEEAIETETEEGEKGEETEAEGVKKRAEERNDPISVIGRGSMRDVDGEMEKQENGNVNGKGKGVDLEEHEGLKLAPPVPMSTD